MLADEESECDGDEEERDDDMPPTVLGAAPLVCLVLAL
jgi:hypothetical protein